MADRFLRIWDIIGDKKADPPIPAIIPVSKSAWWKGIKDEIYPKGLKLSKRVTVWRLSDISTLLEKGCA